MEKEAGGRRGLKRQMTRGPTFGGEEKVELKQSSAVQLWVQK